jgi:hypothetical protein
MKKKNENNKSLGGISSYCLILMIVAYLKFSMNGRTNDIAEHFLGFLDYYGSKFDPKETGISINLNP